jgi:hypothetical protein
MGHLQPTEYENYGLASDTTDDWVTAASALIEGHCRRASLNPLQYVERMRIVDGSQTVRLSYLPLVAMAPLPGPLVAIRARYGRGRRGELPLLWQQEIAGVFGLPGAWLNLDCSTVDWVGDTGELVFPQNVLGLTFNEVEVTYTAGLSVIPDGVKAACALIVKNAQSMPALNVKRSRLDTMEMEYFSNSLVDDVVKALLRPYVANRLG